MKFGHDDEVEEQQKQLAEWRKVTQFTTIYLGLIWVASSLGFIGFFAMFENPIWAIIPGVIFGNCIPNWYANFPSKCKLYEEATRGGPCELSCADMVLHNLGFLILLGIISPVFVKTYEKSHHLIHWHPVVPHWFAVAPLLLILILYIAYQRDRRHAIKQEEHL